MRIITLVREIGGIAMVNICLGGASGRMGRAIVDECLNFPNIGIVSGFIGADETPSAETFPVFNTIEDIREACTNADVWVDFTTPSAIVSNLPLIAEQGVDIVIGTTGWYDKLDYAKDIIARNNISAVISANFSPLINLQFKLAEISADCLGSSYYSFGIVEEHHEGKLDVPSGTADRLADIVMGHTAYTQKKFRTEGKEKKHQSELDMASLRLIGTIGDHEVRIRGESGRMDINTNVYTRREFAAGALSAIEWLSEHRKPRIVFDFYKDVLRL